MRILENADKHGEAMNDKRDELKDYRPPKTAEERWLSRKHITAEVDAFPSGLRRQETINEKIGGKRCTSSARGAKRI
jgi:hypothetical protein